MSGKRLATPRALAAAIDCLAAADPTVATAAVAAVRPHLVSDQDHAVDRRVENRRCKSRVERVAMAAELAHRT